MTDEEIKRLRKHAWHGSPSFARAGNMNLGQLQQFAVGCFTPSQDDLRQMLLSLRPEQPRS
jgi:hypothetical protein